MNINLLLFFREQTNHQIMLRILVFYRRCLTKTLKSYYTNMKGRSYIELNEWLLLERLDVKMMPFLIRDAVRESIAMAHFLFQKPVIGDQKSEDLILLQDRSDQLLLASELSGNQYETIEASILLYNRYNFIRNKRQWHNLYHLLMHSSNWYDVVIYYFSRVKYQVHLYRVLISVLSHAYKNMRDYEHRVQLLYDAAKERSIGKSFYQYTQEHIYLFTKAEIVCIHSIYVTLGDL